MEILKKLERNWGFWSVIIASFLFFLLRLPSLFEPLWNTNEGLYQAIGNSLNNGHLLYREIFDDKPPLLSWLYSLLHSDQSTVKFASIIFGILSIILFFLLSKKLFADKKFNHVPHITTFIFAILFGLPALGGNIANAENFMLLPILAAALLISNQKLFIGGSLLGITFLFRITAVFDLSAFLIYYFILNLSSLRKESKMLKILMGFSTSIFLTSLFFVINGTFIDFAKAILSSNDYKFIPLAAGSIISGIIISYMLDLRNKIGKVNFFILIWLIFSLLNIFSSQHLAEQNFLSLIPSLSLGIGMLLPNLMSNKVVAVCLIIALLIVAKGFGISRFHNSINYYQNFLSYVTGRKTMASYQTFFDRSIPYNYDIARFIKLKLIRNDTIFVWGNNTQLYQLVNVVASTKYIPEYQILKYSDGPLNTRTTIEKVKPKFIVIMPNQEALPFPLIGYLQAIEINKIAVYERVF